MDHQKFRTICNIIFGLLTAVLIYLMPYIAWHTTKYDKTDMLMTMGFAVIPIGLLFLSFLYGLLAKRVVVPMCIASILGIPAIFIPVVAGDTVIGRLYALMLITSVIIIIVCTGTASGILIRWLPGKIRSLLSSLSKFK